MEIVSALELSLVTCDNAEIQVDLCYYGITDFVWCLIDLLNESEALLKVVFRSFQITLF